MNWETKLQFIQIREAIVEIVSIISKNGLAGALAARV